METTAWSCGDDGVVREIPPPELGRSWRDDRLQLGGGSGWSWPVEGDRRRTTDGVGGGLVEGFGVRGRKRRTADETDSQT